LAIQIENRLFERQARARKISNFAAKLPKPQSDLAEQTLKDPYVFDFLSVGQEAHEREVEQELVKHITRFLLELGAGFSFIGEQYHLEVSGQDFYLDLLFYHTRLHCYVIIELKSGEFKPEYAGKMNFYLSAVDDTMRQPDDKPSIGLILCKSKRRLTAEYALRDIGKPIGIADWRTKLVESLPKALKGKLPAIEDLEKELGQGSAG